MKRILSVLFLLFMAAACSSSPPSGEPITWEQRCEPENDGKRVSLEGYLTYSPGFQVVEERGIIVLHEAADFSGEVVPINVSIGTGANQVEAAQADFAIEDIVFRSNDGQTLGSGDRVRVSFSVRASAMTPGNCLYEAPILIERVP